jgi:hypothetical protein
MPPDLENVDLEILMIEKHSQFFTRYGRILSKYWPIRKLATTILRYFIYNNIHEKFLNSDWLRAVQFFRNTVSKMKYSEKKEIHCKFH